MTELGDYVVSVTIAVGSADGPIDAVQRALAELADPFARQTFDVDHIIEGQRSARYFIKRNGDRFEGIPAGRR